VAGGDRGAEADVVRLFSRRIRLYGLRHLRDPQAADDLVQHVLLIVLERLRGGGVREVDRLDSFVLGVCRLSVRDVRRAEQRRRTIGSALAREIEQATAPRDFVDIGRLGPCLDALAERERAVVTQTFYAERPADEIASELGMSTGNVRVVRHRALHRLRRCLGMIGGENGDD
jgi:RNA polymerase sigma-70 factor (ECF subfamily)